MVGEEEDEDMEREGEGEDPLSGAMSRDEPRCGNGFREGW